MRPVGEPSVDDVEAFLEYHEVKLRKEKDGSLTVLGDLYLASMGLTRLPDLSNVDVLGGFTCAYNKLTSLVGSPRSVRGYYSCYNNDLTDLVGATQDIGGNFSCCDNKLTSLKGAPPKTGRFICSRNPTLKSVENAPTVFKDITCDYGIFKSWDEVPERLQTSPETRAEREALATAIRDATILNAPITVNQPLKLRNARAKPIKSKANI